MKVITKLKHNNNARKMENNSNKIIYQKVHYILNVIRHRLTIRVSFPLFIVAENQHHHTQRNKQQNKKKKYNS